MAGDGIGVGLIGCGTVGRGVVTLLLDEAELYARRLGRRLELRRVLRRSAREDATTARLVSGVVTTDADDCCATDDMELGG